MGDMQIAPPSELSKEVDSKVRIGDENPSPKEPHNDSNFKPSLRTPPHLSVSVQMEEAEPLDGPKNTTVLPGWSIWSTTKGQAALFGALVLLIHFIMLAVLLGKVGGHRTNVHNYKDEGLNMEDITKVIRNELSKESASLKTDIINAIQNGTDDTVNNIATIYGRISVLLGKEKDERSRLMTHLITIIRDVSKDQAHSINSGISALLTNKVNEMSRTDRYRINTLMVHIDEQLQNQRQEIVNNQFNIYHVLTRISRALDPNCGPTMSLPSVLASLSVALLVSYT